MAIFEDNELFIPRLSSKSHSSHSMKIKDLSDCSLDYQKSGTVFVLMASRLNES